VQPFAIHLTNFTSQTFLRNHPQPNPLKSQSNTPNPISTPNTFHRTHLYRLFDQVLNTNTMKKLTLILTAALAFVSITAQAQQTEAPKEGAKIFIESKSLDVQPNGESTFDVYIVRSKKAGKSSFTAPKFSGADDVIFEVAQDAANPDHFVVTAKGAGVAGKYFYTVTSRSNSGTQPISGTTLSVSVGGKAVASDN